MKRPDHTPGYSRSFQINKRERGLRALAALAAAFLAVCLLAAPFAAAQEGGVSFSLLSAAGRLAPDGTLTLKLTASCAGVLRVLDAESGEALGSAPVGQGEAALGIRLTRNGQPLSPGPCRITLILESETGERSASRSFTVRVGGEAPAAQDGGAGAEPQDGTEAPAAGAAGQNAPEGTQAPDSTDTPDEAEVPAQDGDGAPAQDEAGAPAQAGDADPDREGNDGFDDPGDTDDPGAMGNAVDSDPAGIPEDPAEDPDPAGIPEDPSDDPDPAGISDDPAEDPAGAGASSSAASSPWSLARAAVSPAPLSHFTLLDDEDSLSLEHPVYAGALRASPNEKSYWTMQLGDLNDEAGIWEILMQPITVLDDHKHSAKESYKLRKTPDNSTSRDNVVGEITYRSQGVHVVEQLDSGWTLVEAYNSSYGSTYKKDGRVTGYGKTGELIRGYVKSDVLMQVNPKEDYGLVIDKYTQTMHIFSKGKNIGSLLVSTGKVNASQPWNETPAGEFIIVSWTGGFWAGNLYCDMGLLLNNGCLIHEVPALVKDQETGFKDYSTTVPYLGQKASHGCIRVQRAKNENGQNMRWLWDNLSINTKVLVWEDSTRYTNYPDDDLTLYYNPVGGNRYHLKQYCGSVNQRYHPLTAFTYGELTESYYKDLVPCQHCTPPERPETILQQNLDNGYPY